MEGHAVQTDRVLFLIAGGDTSSRSIRWFDAGSLVFAGLYQLGTDGVRENLAVVSLSSTTVSRTASLQFRLLFSSISVLYLGLS
jgi:hypothetical protein